MLKRILAGFVAVLMMTGGAAAGPYEDGVAAFRTRDYATALGLWHPIAEQGHAGAQYNLGQMHRRGEGVTRDHAEAVKWYRLAAEGGYARAQTNLGFMYQDGLGVPQDYALAHKWFSLADVPVKEVAARWRDDVAKLMTPDQIAEAQRLAREWLAAH